MGTSAFQFADAQISGPIALLYGVGWVRGNQLALHQTANKDRIVFVGLGEGEWDGINSLIINKEYVDHTDTTKFHFHPGIDGELGNGLGATSTGGDQRVDTFWLQLPAAAKKVTFSRLAYLAMKVAADPKAPSADLDWIGEYRGLKVRIFDNTGAQTSRAHSTNTVWQMLDLIIRYEVKRDMLVAATLTTDEKARFDWASIAASGTFCDYDIGGGTKRVETSFAFPQRIPLRQAIDQMRAASRLIVHEVAGKIYIRAEEARAYSFTLLSKHVIPGSWQPSKREVRGSPNRFIGRFNDLNLAKVATIDTVGNSGAVRTGGNLVTIKTTTDHGFKTGDKYTTQGIAEATMNAERATITVIDANEFSYASTGSNGTSGGGTVRSPYSKFAQRSVIRDHEQHQNYVGQRGLALAAQPSVRPLEIDFGNNTYERVSRMLKFISARTLGEDVAPYHAPVGPQVRVLEDAVDAADNILMMQLVGDVLKVDKSVSEEDQGDYEIVDIKRDPNGGGEGGPATLDLMLSEKVAAAYTDVADEEPDAMATQSVATVLTPLGSPNSVGTIVVPVSSALNPQGSINPVLMGASASFGVGYDATGPYVTVTVTAGDIPQPDGTTISVPASGPTTYRNWAGAAVAASTLYGLNVVWDVATAAVTRDECLGTPSLAFKALAFRDGKIPIVYGAYNTTPAVQGGAGGGSGGGSPCFSGNVPVVTAGGERRFDELTAVVELPGGLIADLLVHDFRGMMLDMGKAELVTPQHLFKYGSGWVAARELFADEVFYEGKVYNLHVRGERSFDERCYVLANGWTAHNAKEPT